MSIIHDDDDDEHINRMLEERIRQVQTYQLRQMLRDASNPFELDEGIFRKEFKVSREMAKYLCNVLICPLKQTSTRVFSVESQVLCALRYFATGSHEMQITPNVSFHISQNSLSRIIKNVSLVIQKVLMEVYINFPNSPESRICARQKFSGAAHPFTGAMGAIDCTHIPVHITSDRAPLYLNRHGYNSLNVQIICDPDFKILGVFPSSPGRHHDSYVWRSSPFRVAMRSWYTRGDQVTWLIGDTNFPQEKFLMTPFRNPSNDEEHYFNSHLTEATSVIQRCLRVLKGTWRCLTKEMALPYCPETVVCIVNTCCILHNMRLRHRVFLPAADMYEGEEDSTYQEMPVDPNNVGSIVDGRDMRRRLAHYLLHQEERNVEE